jgi:hypothetical protein
LIEYLHTGQGQPPFEWLLFVLQHRIYKCSREELFRMRPVEIMRDLTMLSAEQTVKKVRGGGARGGAVQRGMAALRAMVRGR